MGMETIPLTTLIHLEDDQTDFTIRKMRNVAEFLYDQSDYLYAQFTKACWEGSNKDEFLIKLHNCTTNLKILSDRLDLLSFQSSQNTLRLRESAETFNH